MANEFPLAELTTAMMREVFGAISSSRVQQIAAYTELAAEVAPALEDYQNSIIGASVVEQEVSARRYIDTVIVPLLSLSPLLQNPLPIELDLSQRSLLVAHFRRVSAFIGKEVTIEDVIGGTDPTWSITIDALIEFVLAKLRRDMKSNYDQSRALLASGMPNIMVTGGHIETKVTMQASESNVVLSGGGKEPALGLSVKLADERSAVLTRSTELIGAVRMEFRSGTFPAMDLPVNLTSSPLNVGEYVRSIWGSGESDIYLVGLSGAVLHSTTGMGGFTHEPSDTNADLYCVWGSGPNDVYAVGLKVILHRSGASGLWSKAAAPPVLLHGVWGSGPQDIYAVGEKGTILHSLNGVNWTPQVSGVALALWDVWGSGASDIYVVGEGGKILHTDNGGATWVPQLSGTTHNLYGVWGIGANDVYAAGANGTILRTTDHGAHWVPQTTKTVQPMFSVWGSSPSDIFAVGGHGRIHHSKGAATIWETQRIGKGTAMLLDVWGSGENDVYAVANDGSLLHTIDGGSNWL
jgi:photosystem II stability/assembly factor-like uncharacterized protein